MKRPQEDPAVVAERQRQSDIAKQERNTAARKTAQSLTSDLRGIYGIGQMPNVFQATRRAG